MHNFCNSCYCGTSPPDPPPPPLFLQEEGEFSWSSSTQATVLGSFFWGYLVTQVPGGRLAEAGGGKWLFGGGVLLTSLLTLLTPAAARHSLATLIALRVVEGLGEVLLRRHSCTLDSK